MKPPNADRLANRLQSPAPLIGCWDLRTATGMCPSRGRAAKNALLWVVVGAIVVACAAGASRAAGTATVGAPAGSPLGVTLTPTPHPSGITEQEAVTDARQYSSLPTFVSVTSGPYSEVAASRLPPETSPDPNRLVWAVTFTGSAVVCPPPAGPSMASCLPPVPATTVVYLDYETGSFILSTGAPQ
jgi:hypothetical protein